MASSDIGYATGTISVTAGGTVVTGNGTDFLTWVTPGYPLFANGLMVPVANVIDATHLEIGTPWPGSTLVASQYLILFLSKTQLEFDTYRRNVRKLVATLAGATIMVQVPDDQDSPDPGLGDDGDFGIKVFGDETGSAWKFWRKENGVWVSKGAPIGLAWREIWDGSAQYAANDIVSRLGVLYIAKFSNTNKPPETNPTEWNLLLQGGNLFPLLWSDSDMPASGETILKFPAAVPLSFPAGMALSRARADAPSTATAVFSIKKNGVEFATYTFNAGQTNAVFACPITTNFAPGDIYSETAPAPRDSTLFGVSTMKMAYR